MEAKTPLGPSPPWRGMGEGGDDGGEAPKPTEGQEEGGDNGGEGPAPMEEVESPGPLRIMVGSSVWHSFGKAMGPKIVHDHLGTIESKFKEWAGRRRRKAPPEEEVVREGKLVVQMLFAKHRYSRLQKEDDPFRLVIPADIPADNFTIVNLLDFPGPRKRQEQEAASGFNVDLLNGMFPFDEDKNKANWTTMRSILGAVATWFATNLEVEAPVYIFGAPVAATGGCCARTSCASS